MGSEDGKRRERKGKEMFIPRSRPVSLHRHVVDATCSVPDPSRLAHTGGGPLGTFPLRFVAAQPRTRRHGAAPRSRRRLWISAGAGPNKEKDCLCFLHDAARDGRPAAPGLTGVAAGSRAVHQWRRRRTTSSTAKRTKVSHTPTSSSPPVPARPPENEAAHATQPAAQRPVKNARRLVGRGCD
jgi:hypothetical protein